MQALGQFGLQAIRDSLQTRNKASSDKLRILTHCNTGSLATAEYGTALGIIRAAAADSSLGHAYCTETRPYNQGTLHVCQQLAFCLYLRRGEQCNYLQKQCTVVHVMVMLLSPDCQ